MYLGDTPQEKRENYALLTQRAKKLGTFFAVLFGIAAIILAIALIGNVGPEDKIKAIIGGIVIVAVTPFVEYWMGYFWYFGFLTAKSWFAKLGIGAAGATAVAGHGVAVSYLLGGRKAAKMSLIAMLALLMITLAIGFYVGIFNYIKMSREIRSLPAV